MILNKIKHILIRLSIEEKIIGIGSILILISSFLPWFTIKQSVLETIKSNSGLSGDLGIMGVMVFLLTIITLGYLVNTYFRIQLPDFGIEKEKLILFLMGENTFILFLTLLIYIKKSWNYLGSEIGIGIYLAIGGAAISCLSAFSQIKKNNKTKTYEFFNQNLKKEISEEKEEPIINEENLQTSINIENNDDLYSKNIETEKCQEEICSDKIETKINKEEPAENYEYEKKDNNLIKVNKSENQEKAIYEEENMKFKENNLEVEKEKTSKNNYAQDTLNRIAKEIEEKNNTNQNHKANSQSNYFMKEAGLNKTKENNNQINFYNDL